jgi:hypothetical protein
MVHNDEHTCVFVAFRVCYEGVYYLGDALIHLIGLELLSDLNFSYNFDTIVLDFHKVGDIFDGYIFLSFLAESMYDLTVCAFTGQSLDGVAVLLNKHPMFPKA